MNEIGNYAICIKRWPRDVYSKSIIQLRGGSGNSYTDTKLMDMSDRYRLRDDNSPDMKKGMH
jgi:hypothetical protein